MEVYKYDDANAALNAFNCIFLEIAEIHAPHKQIKCKDIMPKWITAEFLSFIDEREHWANIHRRRPSQYTAARKREAMRRVSYMKRQLKRNYINETLADCQGDSKKTWRLIREIWPTDKNSKQQIQEISGETNNFDMAEKLNDHFVSVEPNLSKKFDDNVIPDIIENDPALSFNLREVTYEEVYKLLKALSPSKACEVDGITARLVKACGETIIPPLLHIINTSISTSVFPEAWKCARVTPLYKDGKTTDENNYRPISVLPVLSKIFERLIHDQTYEFVSNANILNARQ